MRPYVLAAVLTLAPLTLAPVARGQELNQEVQHLVTQGKLGTARVGVCIIDGETGDAIASFRGDEKFIPASNMKLLTSAAALKVLGGSFQFRTELLREGNRLILRGGGDPALGDPEILSTMTPKLTVEDVLGVLVTQAKASGLTNVSEFIIDDRVFDREWTHPSWSAENLQRGYSAEVGGLNFHANVIKVFSTPRSSPPQAPPGVRIQPESPWVQIVNRARSVPQGKNTLRLSRETTEDLDNRLNLVGDVGSVSEESITLHNPSVYTGLLVADRLARSGIGVPTSAGSPVVRLAEASEGLSGGQSVAVIATPMTDVLRRCNTFSENLYAECLLKRAGREVSGQPGSWQNGAAVVRMTLTEMLGPDAAAGTVIADGSGLSRENLVTPHTLARWLDKHARRDTASIFVDSLAEPGKPGTLDSRFRDKRLAGEVRAKSGFINGVRSLSGYLTSRTTGRRLAFCILINDVKGEHGQNAKELHEQIVRLADQWLARQDKAASKIGG
jgi:D-alanyl-D-alanine carboxypeptidase/D-alanyl-D-alanine-endopeptidase (penicillin-binding protein 4)